MSNSNSITVYRGTAYLIFYKKLGLAIAMIVVRNQLCLPWINDAYVFIYSCVKNKLFCFSSSETPSAVRIQLPLLALTSVIIKSSLRLVMRCPDVKFIFVVSLFILWIVCLLGFYFTCS